MSSSTADSTSSMKRKSAPVSRKRPRDEQQEPAPSKKASGSGLLEIEALFDDKKQEKQKKIQEEKKKKKESNIEKKKQQQQQHLLPQQGEWKDDGLGGRYNHEGYTGRREDGVKIYKAHLFNSQNFGNTPECPFDCNCCFI